MRPGVLERIGPKPPADVAFADALVVVPGTWVVFDHFTHRATLIGFARDDDERVAVEARLDAYLAKLLAAPRLRSPRRCARPAR